MNLLILTFSIPNQKVFEFNSAMDQLVKWPIYMEHNMDAKLDFKMFELVRTWKSKEDMDKELTSHIYQNLIGVIKALGTINKGHLYTVTEEKEYLLT